MRSLWLAPTFVRRHIWPITTAIAVCLAAGSLGLTLAIIENPQHWFPGAYAPRGEQGPRGPVGLRGPVGPSGPVGPDAATEIADLQGQVGDIQTTLDDLSLDDVQTAVDDLQAAFDDLQNEAGGSQLEFHVLEAGSRLDDLEMKVDGLCSELWMSDLSISC